MSSVNAIKSFSFVVEKCKQVSCAILSSYKIFRLAVKNTKFLMSSGKVQFFFQILIKSRPIPVAARSKSWVCGRSPPEIVGSNPTGGVKFCLL